MVTFVAGFLLAESQNVIFGFFWIKMCCTLCSKIVQSIKIFIPVMVEGIGGRWCPWYWKNFPVPCIGTIGLQSQKFGKSEKIDFFQMIL